MSKVKDKIRDSLSLIDAIKSTLEELGTGKSLNDVIFDLKLPFKKGEGFTLNSSVGVSPMRLLMILLHKFMTYDEMVEWLTKVLVYELPGIELAVKMALLSNLKSDVDCTNDPMIPDKYRVDMNKLGDNDLNGIEVPISSIDYLNILWYSPLSEDGQSLYFGTKKYYTISKNGKEHRFLNYGDARKAVKRWKLSDDHIVDKSEIDTVYELARAEDFNAFLWFATHKARFLNPIKIHYNEGYDSITEYALTDDNQLVFNGEDCDRNVLGLLSGVISTNDGKAKPFTPGKTLQQVYSGNTTLTESSGYNGEVDSNIISLCFRGKKTLIKNIIQHNANTNKRKTSTSFKNSEAEKLISSKVVAKYNLTSEMAINGEAYVYNGKFYQNKEEADAAYRNNGNVGEKPQLYKFHNPTKEFDYYQRQLKYNNIVETKTVFSEKGEEKIFVERSFYDSSKGTLVFEYWIDGKKIENGKEDEYKTNFAIEYKKFSKNRQDYNLTHPLTFNEARDLYEYTIDVTNKTNAEEVKNNTNSLLVSNNNQTKVQENIRKVALDELNVTEFKPYYYEYNLIPTTFEFNSINWYVNRKDYFTRNLTELSKRKRDYTKEFALCNLKYKGAYSRSNEFVNVSQGRIQLRIMPKPFVHMPQAVVEKGEKTLYLSEDNQMIMSKKELLSFFSGRTDDELNAFLIGIGFNESKITNLSDEYQTIVSAFKYNFDWVRLPIEKNSKTTVYDLYKQSQKNKVGVNYETVEDFNVSLVPSFILFDKYGKPTISGKYSVNVKNSTPKIVKENNGKIAFRYEVINKTRGEEMIVNYLRVYKNGKYMLENTNPFVLAVSLFECYPGLTLYEFNYDFVMGMRLYDAEVFADKLIKSVMNLRVGLGAQISKQPSQYQMRVSNIVKKIINSIDSEVSDCFYSFSNAEYDIMLEDSESQRANLVSYNGEISKKSVVNVKSINDILTEFDNTATKHEQTDVLTRAINQAAVELTKEVLPEDRYNVKLDFIENLIQALVNILIEVILTPKVLLLIEVNRKMMGDTSEKASFEAMLRSITKLLVKIVKSIVEMIIQMILDLVLKKIGELLLQISESIIAEQLDFYLQILRDLLENCIPPIPVRRNLETTLDNVNYADIDTNENKLQEDC